MIVSASGFPGTAGTWVQQRSAKMTKGLEHLSCESGSCLARRREGTVRGMLSVPERVEERGQIQARFDSVQ